MYDDTDNDNNDNDDDNSFYYCNYYSYTIQL